jgi:hypothetical protein
MQRSTTTLALILAAVAPLQAQMARPRTAPAASVQAAAATITESEYRQRIGVIADDSMRGRGTPSPELEEVATYIAAEFQRFGLRPGGDNGTFLQRYPIRRYQVDTAQSMVMLMGRGVMGHWQVGRDAIYARSYSGSLPEATITGPVMLVAGAPADTARPFGDAPRGAIVIAIAHANSTQWMNPMMAKAAAAGVRAVVMLADFPAEQFANMARGNNAVSRPEMVLGLAPTPGIPLFLVRDSTAADVLRAAGEDVAALRAGQNGGVRILDGFNGSARVVRAVASEASAPNVIGILEGSDPQLKSEYIFFTGHMDHVGVAGGDNGCRATGADSVCNGADDDASGTTAVVMLAQAFSRLTPRPRRSLVFMTVSGEERGLWGSGYYSEHPVVPLDQTVADINTDMIGRYYNNQPGWRDTIVAIGKEHSTLGATANRVNQAHPELRMTMIDDIWPSENFYSRSDHINFAKKGVPILFFFNGTHPDYHRATDSVDKIDAEKSARITQMVFYLGLDVANTTERPQWNPESRARIVQPTTP